MGDKAVVALRVVFDKTEMLLDPFPPVVRVVSGLSEMSVEEGFLVG